MKRPKVGAVPEQATLSRQNAKSIFWGTFFIAGAGLIVARSMGVLAGITMMNLVICFLLLPIILKSIIRVNFFGVLLPIAILGIIFENELGFARFLPSRFVPWPILTVAVMLSIGLSLIFGRHNKIKDKWHNIHKHNHEHFDNIVDTEDEDIVNFGVTLGSSVKYVNSKNLKQAKLSCSFGALKVYLDNAILSKDGAIISLDSSFSAVQIYMPKEWAVVVGIDSILSGIEEKPKNYHKEKDAPIVRFIGSASFSGIEIIYI